MCVRVTFISGTKTKIFDILFDIFLKLLVNCIDSTKYIYINLIIFGRLTFDKKNLFHILLSDILVVILISSVFCACGKEEEAVINLMKNIVNN